MLKKNRWTAEEEWVLFILRKCYNYRWADIANVILGRSDNSVKNYWNSCLSAQQFDMEHIFMSQTDCE